MKIWLTYYYLGEHGIVINIHGYQPNSRNDLLCTKITSADSYCLPLYVITTYINFLGKGFGRVKIQLPHSIVIELFVTHLQAGNSKCAKNARISQTRQLMEQVDRSKSDAVIVGGWYGFHSGVFSTLHYVARKSFSLMHMHIMSFRQAVFQNRCQILNF